jgi:hypothetical protein
MRILSIDTWAGDEEGTWEWNNWFYIGDITKEEFETLDTDEKVLEFMSIDYIRNTELCGVEDNQYNIIITDKRDGRPLYAIEYGPEY